MFNLVFMEFGKFMDLWAASTNELGMKYHVKMKCDNSVSDYANLESFIKEINQFQLISLYMAEKLAYRWIKQNGKLWKDKALTRHFTNLRITNQELRCYNVPTTLLLNVARMWNFHFKSTDNVDTN